MKKQIFLLVFVLMGFIANAQWQLTGNAGTNPATNFIGTTDTMPLIFRVFNVRSGMLDFTKLNTTFGFQSGTSLSTGNHNTFYGAKAGLSTTTGSGNSFFGHQAGNDQSEGTNNTGIGAGALSGNTTGSANTGIGGLAGGGNLTGSFNTFVGYNTQASVSNLQNATAIGYLATVSASNSIVLGNAANVGIGVSAPLDKLHVVGNIRMVDGNQAVGKVLTSDANGRATWQAIPSLSGTANGDLNGTYPNPTVDGLQGVAVAATAPTAGQVLSFNGTAWPPSSLPAASGTANGDLDGTYPNPTVDGLQGVAVAATAPTTGQVLSFNGTAWAPSSLPAASVDWKTTGNTGTNAATDFVGTADNVSLNFRVNNTRAGRIDASTFTNSIMMGRNAGNNTMTGSDNSIFGNGAGISLTTGSANSFVGTGAGSANTSGTNNTYLGWTAGQNSSTSTQNVFVGARAGSANTTGSGICAFGYDAGNFNDISSTCTFIGNDADQAVLTDFVNSTALGNTARITASNQVRIGNATVTSIGGFANWTNVSDSRFKKDVKETVPGMRFINKLRPVMYHLDIAAINRFVKAGTKNTVGTETLQTGFIAQEVEAAAQQSGYEFSGVDKPKNPDDFYGLRYAEFVVPMVKGMQELDEANKKLQEENQALKKRLDKMESLLGISEKIQTNNQFQKLIVSSNGTTALLNQNYPNPFNNKTVIGYYIPGNARKAWILFSTMNGIALKNISIKNTGEGSIEVDANQLSSGNYVYSLFVDGVLIDSKKLVLVKDL